MDCVKAVKWSSLDSLADAATSLVVISGVSHRVRNRSQNTLGAMLIEINMIAASPTPTTLPRALPRKIRSHVTASEKTTLIKPLREAVSPSIHIIDRNVPASKLLL